MSDIRYNSWLHRSGTGGVYQDSSGKVGIGSSVPGRNLVIEGAAHQTGIIVHTAGNHSTAIDMDSNRSSAAGGLAEINFKWNGTGVGQIGAYSGSDTTNKDDGHIYFGTASAGTVAERLRIDSSGRLLLGTTTEGQAGADDLTIATSGATGITVRSGTSSNGNLFFSDGTSGADEYRGYVQYSHNGDRLVLGTGGVDRVTIDNAGNTNISGVCTATSFVPTEGQTSHRNIIINGDMSVAQRGTSDTSNSYYSTVDRWNCTVNGLEENVTRSQESLSSSDTGPYEKGFRNAWKFVNGNQTGGADAGGYIIPQYLIEAQNIANSGWNPKSASSYITLSFWVKSSVAQTFYGFFRTIDGTGQAWSFSYALSANTWTKVTKTIPGNSNIDINDDTGTGLALYLPIFMGTDRTNSNNTEETWAAYVSSNRTKDSTTTWYTTNDATWHITGVQLEVGSVATPFEHRSYGDELARCQRYYQRTDDGGCGVGICIGNSSGARIQFSLPVVMRASPTVSKVGNNIYIYDGSQAVQVSGLSQTYGINHSVEWEFDSLAAGSPLTSGRPLVAYINGSAGGLQMDAEL